MLTYKGVIDKINREEPLAFARYGDGEWSCIFGHEGENCDGHVYSDELSNDIRTTIYKPHAEPYFYSEVRVARKVHGAELDRWQNQNSVWITWEDGTMFVDASRRGDLYPFLSAIRKREVLYLCPKFISDSISTIFTPKTIIEVPSKNAYHFKTQLLAQTKKYLSKQEHDIVLFSAGPATKVFMYELWKDFSDLQMIDVGSLFDGFCGKMSRSYQRSSEWQSKKMINLWG